MARRHFIWRGRGGSFKLPLESIRRLNEPPRRCELIVIRRYSPPCTTARRGGCVIKENFAKPPKQTQPGWFSFSTHLQSPPAYQPAHASQYFLNRPYSPPCSD